MLEIKNLCCSVEKNPILKNLNLSVGSGEVHAIMGPNGSGKSTLASVIAGNENYEIEGGEINFLGKNVLDLSPEMRAHMGLFLSFQYPVEIPGVSVSNFIKTAINQHRSYNELEPMKAPELLKKMKENLKMLNMSNEFLSRFMNEGFSGGEKKRNEIFQLAMLRPTLAILDETDSGLDIDALKIVSRGVNKLRSENRSFIIITHYQRLLNYIRPDFVHVLANGSIVKSGDFNLAGELEKTGYDKF